MKTPKRGYDDDVTEEEGAQTEEEDEETVASPEAFSRYTIRYL